ncbi:hypothetical protein M409DRAFT_29574 [Zasmidium cellare ATCC 36951]|uniref:Uncharacterized protein n=1 Tax=Zasmidium cellare ATCC 36951 TaxID=1080233 RepID=A0A6A6BYU1_ZASCE|nr:uncharacterized protein M409DRAFT_29574 [Zasmidium cellare ATCC 36951]KAF2159964.1 hypothetical protein M409DRAFT_29574 [Zasmidium cellare ATCC 36951]
MSEEIFDREEDLEIREGHVQRRWDTVVREASLHADSVKRLAEREQAVQQGEEEVKSKERRLQFLDDLMSDETASELTRRPGRTPTWDDLRSAYRDTMLHADAELRQSLTNGPSLSVPYPTSPGGQMDFAPTATSPASPPQEQDVGSLLTSPTSPVEHNRDEYDFFPPTLPANVFPPMPAVMAPESPLRPRRRDPGHAPPPRTKNPIHLYTGKPILNYNPNSFDPANNPWAGDPRLKFD